MKLPRLLLLNFGKIALCDGWANPVHVVNYSPGLIEFTTTVMCDQGSGYFGEGQTKKTSTGHAICANDRWVAYDPLTYESLIHEACHHNTSW